jgi:hypothetical protein
MMKRVVIAALLSLPGIALAMAAKPLILGGDVLFLGIALAFAVPVGWLCTRSI